MRAMGDSGEGGGGYSVFIVTGRWENFGWHLLWKYIVTRDFWGVLNKSGKIQQWIFCGLRCRGNLTPVSNVCAAALTSLFWALNGLYELPEVHFEFPFNLIGKSTLAFLIGQSWRVLKSWYTGGSLERGFRCCSVDGLNQSLVSSVAQARFLGV